MQQSYAINYTENIAEVTEAQNYKIVNNQWQTLKEINYVNG